MKFFDCGFTDSIATQFSVDIIESNLVEFVDGNSDINDFIGLANHLGNTCEDLTVVYLDLYIDTQASEDGIDNLHEFDLIEQGVATNDVGVALVELAITTTLRTVGAPYGLYLIALKRQL